MSEVLIDSYYVVEPNIENMLTGVFPDGSGFLAQGQTFSPSISRVLTSCKFYLRKYGSPTGTVRAYIYALDGPLDSGKPTGDPLAVSDPLDIAALPTSRVLRTFTFSGLTVLQANTPYALILYSTDGDLATLKEIRIAGNDVGAHDGRAMRFPSALGAWQLYATMDFLFYLYGTSAKIHPFWWFKKPPCPSGEQIVNGGLETGDFTGWVETGNNQNISEFDPHSGTYCANLYRFQTWVGAIKQELAEPISYSCIETFTAWFAAGTSAGDYLTIVITYSDDTTTEWTEFTGTDVDWHEIDIKAHLDPSKAVKAIEFKMPVGSADVRIDDVSLIGSG